MIMNTVFTCDGKYPPVKGHYEDAGVDLRAQEEYIIRAGGSITIDTMTMADIPVGYWGKLESKSGLNVNNSVVSLGGTIDSKYSGHIRAKLYNFSDDDYHIRAGDKIVQLVIMPCVVDGIEGVEIQTSENRGKGGFGSTGR